MAAARCARWGWRGPALLGALVTAAPRSACGDAGDPGARGRAGRSSGARAAAAWGWSPAGAGEAAPVASLHAGSAGDPLCADVETALDRPRALITAIDKELREATRMSDEEEDRIG